MAWFRSILKMWRRKTWRQSGGKTWRKCGDDQPENVAANWQNVAYNTSTILHVNEKRGAEKRGDESTKTWRSK